MAVYYSKITCKRSRDAGIKKRSAAAWMVRINGELLSQALQLIVWVSLKDPQ